MKIKEVRAEDLEFSVSPIILNELNNVRKGVINQDRDYVMIIDGEEGAGKSVLSFQVAKILDPKFSLKNVCFNADQFIHRIKSCPKYSCVVLDEAFSSANSRASMSDVNRAMIAVATEMRQRNLFVIIVIPSFFDLDKYFALWRCRALFHVYFTKGGARGSYCIFPRLHKKYLYLNGKKFYNYSKPRSPFPVFKFSNFYTIDEKEYRERKAEAFRKRTLSNQAKKWKGQRDGLIKALYHDWRVMPREIIKKLVDYGERALSEREVERIVQLG